MRSLIDRFLLYVNKDGPVPEHHPELGPCWLWTGARSHPSGYGVLRVNGRLEKAHRVAVHLYAKAQLAEPWLGLHACDNKSCVNPGHLRPGTHLENMADVRARGRRKGLALGTRNGNAKLTPAAIANIVNDAESGMRSGEIGRKYGISRRHVIRVVKRAA